MKKVRAPRDSTRMVYFGQRTEKDAPVFVLSQVLQVWGQAPCPPAPPFCAASVCGFGHQLSATFSAPALPKLSLVQGELFAAA